MQGEEEEAEFSDTHFWYSSVDDLENEYVRRKA